MHNTINMHNKTKSDSFPTPARVRRGATAARGGTSLNDLLERSIRLGQRRVALQRLMMMEASGIEVSQVARDFCRPVQLALPLREIERMRQVAGDWAAMIGHRGW